MIDKDKLLEQAQEASGRAYAPYSHFRVGAALLCRDGTVFEGVNVENRSYGLTNCAERSALFTAVSSGYTDFSAIAISTPDSGPPVPPCGACRQALSEFATADFIVIFSGSGSEKIEMSLTELYPFDSV